jgi:putative Holliday junction resolvase
MRLIGFDLGTKTMGIAITDSNQTIASGLENFTYNKNNLQMCLNKIQQLLKRYENDIAGIILGYPTNTNGTKNERTYLIEEFKALLDIGVPKNIKLVLQDERFTTQKATGMLKFEAGLKSSQIKKIKDKMSAVVILNEYLEINHGH